jgi:hypothetical protein
MIKVYFENMKDGVSNYAELVAIFDNEDTYYACLPALEELAQKANMEVTESEEDEADINDL